MQILIDAWTSEWCIQALIARYYNNDSLNMSQWRFSCDFSKAQGIPSSRLLDLALGVYKKPLESWNPNQVLQSVCSTLRNRSCNAYQCALRPEIHPSMYPGFLWRFAWNRIMHISTCMWLPIYPFHIRNCSNYGLVHIGNKLSLVIPEASIATWSGVFHDIQQGIITPETHQPYSFAFHDVLCIQSGKWQFL